MELKYMSNSLRQKIFNFLKEYRDLYGDNIFLDEDHLISMKKNTPRLSLPLQEKQEVQSLISEEYPLQNKSDSDLWEFMRQIKDCTKCPLKDTRTHFVFGEGNEHADIMFIGEAPGAEEDRTGRPFVGRAGQLLNKLLSHIKVRREDVFITNILKCRPPNNRDPLPNEVEECLPYLHRQIELIQPKIIVALGRIAAQNLLNTTAPLKQLRERLWQYKGVNLIVTYHPAAILRNIGLLNTAIQDLKFMYNTYQQSTK
jgi:uracil-DNA glycosylase family 4